MTHVSTGRAIIIALLFIALPVFSAEDGTLAVPAMKLVEPDRSNQGAVTQSPVMLEVDDRTTAVDPKLDTDQNKDKLTIFFAIGLIINILLMSLFGIWAVRQWRKTDKRG